MQVDTLYIESTAKSENYDFWVFLPSVKIATHTRKGITVTKLDQRVSQKH